MFEKVRGDMGGEIDTSPLVTPAPVTAAEPAELRISSTLDRDAVHVTISESISASLSRGIETQTTSHLIAKSLHFPRSIPATWPRHRHHGMIPRVTTHQPNLPTWPPRRRDVVMHEGGL